MAQELAREQQREFQLVTSGSSVTDDSISNLIWKSLTDLPQLPDRFDDPELGAFAKALYEQLVPPGEGHVELTGSQAISQIERLRKS